MVLVGTLDLIMLSLPQCLEPNSGVFLVPTKYSAITPKQFIVIILKYGVGVCPPQYMYFPCICCWFVCVCVCVCVCDTTPLLKNNMVDE